MSMHARVLLLLILLWPLAADARAPRQVIGYLQGEIAVAADGQVKSVKLKHAKSPELEAFFVSQIKGWEFYPVTVNGLPTDAVAPFEMTVLATFGEGRKIQKIEFRTIHIGKSDIEQKLSANTVAKVIHAPVRYPEAGLRNGLSAEARVAVEIGADGRVKQAGLYDLGLLDAGSRNDRRVREFALDTFGKVSVEGLSKWVWTAEGLAEMGCRAGCIRLIAVSFTMDSGNPKAWSSYAEQVASPPAWAIGNDVKPLVNEEQSRYVQFKTDPSNTAVAVDI